LKYIILNVLIVLAFVFKGYSQFYGYKNFNHKDGLTTNRINDIHQSSNGIIWLATDKGIFHYDGNQFQSVPNQHANTSISGLDINKKGVLLFTSEHSGLFSLNKKKSVSLFQSNRSKAKYTGVFTVNEYTLVTYNNSILLLNGENIIFQKRISQHKTIIPHQFIKIPNGAILLTNQGGFYYSNTTKEISILEDFIPNYSNKFNTGFIKKNILYLFDNQLKEGIKIILNRVGKPLSNKKITFNSLNLTAGDEILTCAYSSKLNKEFIYLEEWKFI